MYKEYSLEVKKIFKGAEEEMINLHHPYVGTEHLLLSLLKNAQELQKIFLDYDLTYDDFKRELINIVGSSSKKSTCILYTPMLKKVINSAINIVNGKLNNLKPIHLLSSLLEEGEGIAIRILISMKINIHDLENKIKNDSKNNKCIQELYNIGYDLSNTIDLNDVCLGRSEELNLIIETLIRKNKNNPLLIGEAGVGKTAIVEELARKIKKKEVPNALKDTKIISIAMSSLVAGTKYRGEFEEKINKIINEIAGNPNIILFIDEIHTIVNAGGAEGAVSASDILKPYLARGKIKIIGATTLNEYNKFILKDKALNRRFEIINIKEPSIDETVSILLGLKPSFEEHYKIKITKENIKDIVNLSDKYILNRCNPDKSIDILDSLCAMKTIEDKSVKKIFNLQKKLQQITSKKEEMVCNNNFKSALELMYKEQKIKNSINNKNEQKRIITKEEILKFIKKKNNIPDFSDNSLYDSLLEFLQSKLIGQDKALKQVVLNILEKEEDKPLSILLTGSTGVGKTQTVKLISEYLKIPLIRLDGSEYATELGISKLIGASAGFVGYDDECILDKVRLNPYSIILFDEIEKAHPSILNLFLQILDEGVITNARGEKLNFRNTYIFATSNATLHKNIGFFGGIANLNDYFSKEFTARFTDIISYNSVTKEMVQELFLKNGINDLSKLEEINYQNMGFRSIDKILRKININN